MFFWAYDLPLSYFGGTFFCCVIYGLGGKASKAKPGTELAKKLMDEYHQLNNLESARPASPLHLKELFVSKIRDLVGSHSRD